MGPNVNEVTVYTKDNELILTEDEVKRLGGSVVVIEKIPEPEKPVEEQISKTKR